MNDNDKDTLTEEDYYLKSIACGCCPQCAKGFLVLALKFNKKD